MPRFRIVKQRTKSLLNKVRRGRRELDRSMQDIVASELRKLMTKIGWISLESEIRRLWGRFRQEVCCDG